LKSDTIRTAIPPQRIKKMMEPENKKGTKRLGYREGSIHQRSKTRWVAMLSLGYNAQGRRKRRAIYGTTKREVQEKLTKLQQASAFDRFPMRRPVRHLDSTRGRAKSASVKSTEVPVVNGQRAHDPGN
jgi:hypothetical protein